MNICPNSKSPSFKSPKKLVKMLGVKKGQISNNVQIIDPSWSHSQICRYIKDSQIFRDLKEKSDFDFGTCSFHKITNLFCLKSCKKRLNFPLSVQKWQITDPSWNHSSAYKSFFFCISDIKMEKQHIKIENHMFVGSWICEIT